MDFFLSYATSDNLPAIPGRADSAWVSFFREMLCRQLEFFLQRPVKFFYDEKDLSGNSPLTPEIEQALQEARVFVAISTPTYYTRPWCKLERQKFIARLQPEPAMTKRVFVVHLTDVDPHIAPKTWQGEFFPDVKGYQFYDVGENGRLYTLGKPVLDLKLQGFDRYYSNILKLAEDMAKKIKEFDVPAEVRAPEPFSDPVATSNLGSGQTKDLVFLAENSALAREEREEIRVALECAQFEVRSALSLVGKIGDVRTEAQGNAIAFVQMVSAIPMEIPGSGGATYDQGQLEGAAGLPSYRWRAPELNVEAVARAYPGFKEFATAPDVRVKLLPKFKEELLEGLKALAAKKRVQAAVQGDDRLVLITGDPADWTVHGTVLRGQLQQHALGHLITKQPEEELEADDVRGFLVLYGGSPAEYVKDWLSIVRRLPKTRRKDLRVGVYFCAPPPPHDRRELLFDLPSFHKIRWDDPASFDAFAKAVSA